MKSAVILLAISVFCAPAFAGPLFSPADDDTWEAIKNGRIRSGAEAQSPQYLLDAIAEVAGAPVATYTVFNDSYTRPIKIKASTQNNLFCQITLGGDSKWNQPVCVSQANTENVERTLQDMDTKAELDRTQKFNERREQCLKNPRNRWTNGGCDVYTGHVL